MNLSCKLFFTSVKGSIYDNDTTDMRNGFKTELMPDSANFTIEFFLLRNLDFANNYS